MTLKQLFKKSIAFILVFLFLSPLFFAQGKDFRIKNIYLEVQRTSYPLDVSLFQRQGSEERPTGQATLVDQYKIANIPENEFLDEYPELKQSFQGLKMDIEADQPVFNKENFQQPSLFGKIKSLFGSEATPEYKFTKKVSKSKSVQTELDLKKVKVKTHYQEYGIENLESEIKQTIVLTNNSDQEINLSLLLKHKINTDEIFWNNQEYSLRETPQKFVNPNRISFNTGDAKSFYDFSDIPDGFSPELWAEKKDSDSLLILSLNVSVPAHSSETIDPTYGTEITILNVHSHPQAGDNWTVSFETKGKADLWIIPEDQETIDDLDFISLRCGNQERTPQILENDVIFYPNWYCEETGELVHLVKVAQPHTLKFQFGEQIKYAYNSPGAVTIGDGDLSKGGAVVETSGGTKYAIFVALNVVEVWKDIDGAPSLADSDTAATVHGAGNIAWCHAAIDSADDIHIVCQCDTEQTRDVAYAVFDCGTDQLGAWEEAADYTEVAPLDQTLQLCQISIDSGDLPHIIYTDNVKITGGATDQIYYTWKDGTWQGPEQVNATASKRVHMRWPSLTHCPSDDVEALYIDDTTAYDVHYRRREIGVGWDTESEYDEGNPITLASNSVTCTSGDTVYRYHQLLNSIHENNVDTTYNSANTDRFASPTLDGTDRYVFYIDTNSDVHLISNSGSGWTDKGTLQAGTFYRVIAQYSYLNNNQYGELNYIFDDGTNVYYDSFSLGYPMVSNVYFNAGSSVTLVENTIKSVNITGQVIDTDGASDCTTISALAYRSGASSTCTSDENNCYRDVSCNTSVSGSIISCTCPASIWFHADRTDDGTYSGQWWEGAILATDSSSNAELGDSSSSTDCDLLTLLALDVTASIAYGSMLAGTSTGSTNQTTVVTATGNVPINCSLKGTDVTGGASGTVVASKQHHDLSAFTYGGTENTLTTSDVAVELVTSKPSTNPSDSSDIIWWGIGVDEGAPAATDYSGYNTFTATASICPGDSVSYEGTTYDLVAIGDQCWFAENLNVGTKLASAASEPNTTDEIIEKWCYNSDEATCTSDGGLYNWDEMLTVGVGSQGICPDGWHIASDTEWTTLEDNVCGDTGDEGSALAGYAELWSGTSTIESDNDFDCSGFKALPAGYRSDSGDNYQNRGNYAYLWSATEFNVANAWYRGLDKNATNVNRNATLKASGLSVRCLRD